MKIPFDFFFQLLFMVDIPSDGGVLIVESVSFKVSKKNSTMLSFGFVFFYLDCLMLIQMLALFQHT